MNNIVRPAFGGAGAKPLKDAPSKDEKAPVGGELHQKIARCFEQLTAKSHAENAHKHPKLKPERLTLGPYNARISYPDSLNGEPLHSLGATISAFRDARKRYSYNAVEWRCDALGLVIYVSGCIQASEDKNSTEHLNRAKAAVFDNRNLEPTQIGYANSASELLTFLHTTLVKTYNRLSTLYNLVGLSEKDLTLKTSLSEYPNICIKIEP